MITRNLLPLAATLLAAVPAVGQQQTAPQPGEPRPFEVPAARNLTLPNGLAVSLIPYGEVPKATVTLTLRVGNVDEGAAEVWLADVMGDLLQEGTTSRSAERIAQDAAGMGGDVSVSIGENLTTVAGDALSEFTPQMVALIADLVLNPAFPEQSLERIRADRQRQLAIQLSQPQSRALRQFRAALYPDQAYGRVFPTADMVQGYTVERVRRFHAENVSAARARLYISGRFDAAATEAAIREAFGSWDGGSTAPPATPSPRAERVIHLVDSPGAAQSTIYMGLPVVDPSDEDFIALQVTNSLLGGAFASRITSNIREQKGYTYSPYSTVSTRYRDAYWAEIADVTTAVTGPALTEILGEIERLRDEAPPADELRGIQNYMAGTFVLQNSSRRGIVSQLSFVDLHGLGREWLERYVPRLHEVTPEDVQRVTRAHIDPARMTIVVVGDRAVVESQLEEFGEVRLMTPSP